MRSTLTTRISAQHVIPIFTIIKGIFAFQTHNMGGIVPATIQPHDALNWEVAMRNGLYKVMFQTPLGQGAGVVILRDGELRGGDSLMYYTGTYDETGNQFTATVKTDQHSSVPGMAPVFGKPRVTINITGQSQGDTLNATGRSPNAPGVGFQATLSRLCD